MPTFVRQLLLALLALPAAALLSACASSPAPALQLHSLGSLMRPAATTAATTATTQPSTIAPPTWQLLAVQLPAYLDRDALLVPAPGGGLQALAGERWAEPLRDALPRLLRDDLASLRGAASIWAAPLPAGVLVQHQLRVEVLALDVLPGRSAVRLRARWWLADVAAATATTAAPAPLLGEADLQTSAAGRVAGGVASTEASALVAAHRALLWQLAERISASAGPR